MEEQPTTQRNEAKQRRRFTALIATILVVGAAIIVTLLVSGRTPSNVVVSAPEAKVAVIEVTKDGFSPATLTIEKGSVVEWRSTDGTTTHIVEANPYPSHTSVPDLVSGQLGSGATYRYKFADAGSFGFHDKLNPTLNGTIVVQ